MREFHGLAVDSLASIDGGPLHGTEYSLAGACDLCGAGAEAVGPRIMRSFRVSKGTITQTLDGEILVRMDIADGLKALGIESLADVYGVKTGERLPMKELRAEATLPPFSPQTTGYEREGACPKCSRDGYFGIPHVPLKLVYTGLPADYANRNVLATYERFGNSRLRAPFKDSVFARPVYVVSHPVAQYLKKECGRRVVLDPVEITWMQ